MPCPLRVSDELLEERDEDSEEETARVQWPPQLWFLGDSVPRTTTRAQISKQSGLLA